MEYKSHILNWAIQVGIIDVLEAGVGALYKHNFLYALQDPKNIEAALGIATGLVIYDVAKTLYKSHKVNKPMVDSLITRARELGIKTLGKTAEEIRKEVTDKSIMR